MAIIVKNTKITDEIVNEKGEVLGIISYDPNDLKSRKEIINIINDIYKLEDSLKKADKINISQFSNAKTMEEFEKARDSFNQLRVHINQGAEHIEDIIKRIDNIFGEGTCKIVLNDTYNLELLIPLLNGVLPQFEKVQNEKKNKYLDGVRTDVMN